MSEVTMASFSMNIVTIDFFMSKPVAHFDPVHSQLRNFVVQKVPVIRIFGNDVEGKKTCVFVHGVFPYLYIPFPHDPINEKTLQQLSASIDKALNSALGYKDSVQHVFHISVCKKFSMYGYNEKEATFLKVLLYEPYHISKLEDLLLNGAVFNERFQPHESHVPYILQFCMDYNLYGMSYIAFSHVKFRNEKENSLPKLSHCKLEADVKSEHVIVSLTTNDSDMKNPGLRAIWKDEEGRRKKLNKSSTITPQLSQIRSAKMHNTEKIFREKLHKNIQNYKRRNQSVLSMSTLDETVVQDELNCTLDAMILDQLNELAEDNTQQSKGIDDDSILGTQMLKDDEPGEDWTDEIEALETEVNIINTNTNIDLPILDDLNKSCISQDLFADLKQSDPISVSNIQKHQSKNGNSSSIEKVVHVKSVTDIPESDPITPSSESDLFSQGKSENSSFTLRSKTPTSSGELENQIISKTSSTNQSSFSHKTGNFIKFKCKPISRALIVEELVQNDVSNILSQKPFYSNMTDITKTEVNNKFLDLKAAPVSCLEEHKCLFLGMSEWRRHLCFQITGDDTSNVNDIIGSFRNIFPNSNLIKPIVKPPSCKTVTRWLQCKDRLKANQSEKLNKPEKQDLPESIQDSPCSSQKGVVSEKSFKQASLRVDRKRSRSSFDSDMFPSSPSPESNQSSQSKDTNSNDSIQRDLLKSFIRRQLETPKRKLCDSYAIDAMTPNTTGDFQMGLDNLNEVTSHVEDYYLTVLAIEIHAISRASLKPDPNYDEVKAIFYYLYTCPPDEDRKIGIIIIGHKEELPEVRNKQLQVSFVSNEKELFATFIEKVREWDPDILVGYEIETLSWGYLLERGYILELNLNTALSRIVEVEKRNSSRDEVKSVQLQVPGRIIINLWRLLRHEVTLQSYTFENIMYHVLHERVPLFSYKLLTSWWEHRTRLYKWMTVEHYVIRVTGIIRLIEQLDLIGRTSEMARLFGIQFYEVLSRGSQFRVESIMLRLARLNNFVAASPSVKQRAHMRAPESLPLILEPESRLYTDPIIVLDFQSLYPSVIIAYNYCFSTCLGRVEHLGVSERFPFGCLDLDVSVESLKKLQNSLTISPSGVAFVNKSVRCGILPRMLQEILDTRLMVKQSMKEYKNNSALQRVLHARQLGLKLIANVTYGYTAANFSGRMPCIEVGDSVVSKGRETLQKAIEIVNTTKKWQCRVVYGDTDSMFVLASGKTKQEAFEIGKDIANVVTNSNPTPVKLKFEKVYQPCILQTKKRYVGFMYESVDQEKPIYEAKGIETVRRDGCPAVSKILKKSLCLLFETKDLSVVKQYVEKQFSKIISGRISVQDMTFAKEYRGQAGYKPGACVPALSLARTWLQADARSEPRVGERVPYVIVSGAPGLPLIKLVKSPHELLQDFSLRLNSEYYITRVIVPPLERCFLLLGTPILPWYTNLPRKLFVYLPSVLNERKKKSTISQYFASVNCVCCNNVTQNKKGVCDVCLYEPQLLATCLYYKIQSWQWSQDQVTRICSSCVGRSSSIDCISLDCPVLYRRTQIKRDLDQLSYVLSLCDSHLTLF
uniref:DNA polymerase n=1 Tax=Cacopsylla melanoneura TaxID=428564 RepID=A0A8D9BNJ6_9HEMI